MDLYTDPLKFSKIAFMTFGGVDLGGHVAVVGPSPQTVTASLETGLRQLLISGCVVIICGMMAMQDLQLGQYQRRMQRILQRINIVPFSTRYWLCRCRIAPHGIEAAGVICWISIRADVISCRGDRGVRRCTHRSTRSILGVIGWAAYTAVCRRELRV